MLIQLKGKCNLNVRVPQTQKSLSTEFYVTHGKAATLLGRDASELLGLLRVGIPVNNCDVKSDGASNNSKQARKASLRKKGLPKGKVSQSLPGPGEAQGVPAQVTH